MKKSLLAFGSAVTLSLAFSTGALQAETLTIATVNNGDMIRMQKLTDDFTKKNPGIDVEWVTLEENVLRQRVTTDIATKGGQYDIMTIGTYEVPIWAERGWLVPAYKMPKNRDDLVVQRVVVKEDFSRDLAERLLDDLKRAVEYFESQPGHAAKEEGSHFHH